MGPLPLLRFPFFEFPLKISLSMDFDKVKAEKAKALSRFHRFGSIGFFFRVTEICVALLLVCWIITCLPFAVRISGEFLRRLACVVSTPLFMFFLGNSIVVALLTTKSTVFSSTQTFCGAEADIYEAFTRSGENCGNSSDVDLTEGIIVYDDKQIIATETNSNSTVVGEDHVTIETDKDSNYVTDLEKNHPQAKVYRRSKSEISAKQSLEMVSKPSLQRSETEKCRKIVESCQDNYPENNMTNEEFQKTIETFIAKQLILRRRESLAVVIHNQM